MSFTLPKLQYEFNELEPFIDTKTMEIHYGKHHVTYTKNLNQAISNTIFEKLSIQEIFEKAVHKNDIRNNSGGYYNHNLFWNIIGRPFSSQPSKKFLKIINNYFSSWEAFKNKFSILANSHFGSGWIWLSLCLKEKTLFITSSINQDNPLMYFSDRRGIPIFCLDVWEHAYYLKYKNRRDDYIEAFWKIVNWNNVIKNYESVIKN